MPDTSGRAPECVACPIAETGRRQFVRELLIGVVGIVLAPSLAGASALRVEVAKPIASKDDTRTYPIPNTDSVQIDHDADVILVRWANVVYAFNLSCPHQNTALRWIDDAKHFQCPKHKSQYTPAGEFITGRATRGMDRLGISREGSNVTVKLDSMFRQDKDATNWAAALVRLT